MTYPPNPATSHRFFRIEKPSYHIKSAELQNVQLEQGEDDDDDDEHDSDPLSSAPEGFQTAIARVAIESIGFKMLLLDDVRRARCVRCRAACAVPRGY